VLPSEILHSVLDPVPDAMLIVNASGSIVFLNRQVSVLFGYDANEVKGQHIELLLPERFRAQHVRHCHDFAENGRLRPMGIGLELFALRKDGTEFPVEISLSPIADGTGTLVAAAIRDVTERNRGEAAAHEVLEVHKAMLAASLDGYWLVDADGRLLDANQAYVLQSGYTRVELVGMHVRQLDVAVSAAEVTPHLQKVVATGSEVFESVHRRKDGSTWHAEISAIYSKHRGGQVHAFFRDITERKRAAAALRASEARLRTLVATEPECVKVVDRNGALLEMNAAGLAMLEAKSLEEARTHGIVNFICPEHRASFSALHRRVINGERGELEFQIVGLHGTHRWLRTSAAPMWDDSLAETVLLGITSDITERKRLEIKLATESARNRLFLRTASDGVHIQNAAGNLVEVSESFCKMLGYEHDEIIGMNPSQWDARFTREELPAAFTALKSGALKRFKTLHRRKDGTIFPVEIHAECFDVDGERHVYCSARDITDQRRLERALLETTNTEQQKLGRDMHDGLGQELTGISLLATAIASSLKRTGHPEAAELEKLASLARRAIANCRAIAHGLSPLTFADDDLVEVLKEMVTLQRDSFGIDARCEVIEAAPLRLGADARDNLYRISQEAVANARRHGRAQSIQVTLNIQPTTVRLDVLDDGIGFGPTTATSIGMGLKIMQVRAATIGARLSIGPGDHGGTRVTCECPQPAENVVAMAAS
jgi:PAS domain S-box-containing protein